MNKTILFFLALMLVTTTACGRGNSNNNPVKEETMATEGNGKVIHLTKAEFLAKVYNFEKNPEEWKYEGDKPAIVDFYADWCGPCKLTSPIIEELSEEHKDVSFVKVNVDNNQELASQYSVFSIPTFIVFKDGKLATQFVGAMGKEGFEEQLNKAKM